MQNGQYSDNEIAQKMKTLTQTHKANSDEFESLVKELYSRNYPRGFNIARYYGLNRDDARDAVQNAFIKLIRSIKSYNSKKKFFSWYYKIVLNCVRDKYNDLKKHKYGDIENVNAVSKNNFDEFHVREVIRGIISELPEKMKSVVLLRVYGELGFKDISTTLGVSVRQLHNRLNAAYVIIKERLEEGKG